MRAVGPVGIPPPGNDGLTSTGQGRRRQARLENSPAEPEVDLAEGVLQEDGLGQVSEASWVFWVVNRSASSVTGSTFLCLISP